MKSRKVIAAVGLALSVGMMAAGCGEPVRAGSHTEVKEMDLTEEKQDAQPLENTKKEEVLEKADQEAEESKQNESQTVGMSEGTEHLGGKVQSAQEDGMIFAQTTLMDDDGSVTLLEMKDAEKIPVKFTADTRIEHWTIQGGGADIDRKEAAVSDLQEGMGVEMEGYFEGETFVAVRVIIEEYV